MERTSEVILALKPVTFHYKDADTKKAENTPQFGLIAEDVAEVNPDLVVLDGDGEPLTVRYDAVNAMLLNEFLKEHKKIEATTDQHHATKLHGRAAARKEWRSHGPVGRAGSANSKSERPTGTDQTCSANRAERPVERAQTSEIR